MLSGTGYTLLELKVFVYEVENIECSTTPFQIHQSLPPQSHKSHITNNPNLPLPLRKKRREKIIKHQIFLRRLKDPQVFECTENGSDADI